MLSVWIPVAEFLRPAVVLTRVCGWKQWRCDDGAAHKDPKRWAPKPITLRNEPCWRGQTNTGITVEGISQVQREALTCVHVNSATVAAHPHGVRAKVGGSPCCITVRGGVWAARDVLGDAQQHLCGPVTWKGTCARTVASHALCSSQPGKVYRTGKSRGRPDARRPPGVAHGPSSAEGLCGRWGRWAHLPGGGFDPSAPPFRNHVHNGLQVLGPSGGRDLGHHLLVGKVSLCR
jgi:hypothetical protein